VAHASGNFRRGFQNIIRFRRSAGPFSLRVAAPASNHVTQTQPISGGSSPHDDFFQQLADGAPVMIWMSGLDMGCFYFNRAWLDFRGRTLEQEFGNGWAEGVHPEDLQRCVNHYISCFERRIAFAMSYRLQDYRGAYRWILDRGAPHYLPDGTFLGFFGGCADIETDTPISRHAELGSSLAAMKEFARGIAAEEALAQRASHVKTQQQLAAFAREQHEEYQEQLERAQHAVGEMNQLATDMLAFGAIARGACLP
jgi:PAS domain S-box-containing protein